MITSQTVASVWVLCAGVRSLAFSVSPKVCTETNMHSKQVSNITEAVQVATEWLLTPGFVWSTEAALAELDAA